MAELFFKYIARHFLLLAKRSKAWLSLGSLTKSAALRNISCVSGGMGLDGSDEGGFGMFLFLKRT